MWASESQRDRFLMVRSSYACFDNQFARPHALNAKRATGILQQPQRRHYIGSPHHIYRLAEANRTSLGVYLGLLGCGLLLY